VVEDSWKREKLVLLSDERVLGAEECRLLPWCRL
jgi:hypothetical protein